MSQVLAEISRVTTTGMEGVGKRDCRKRERVWRIKLVHCEFGEENADVTKDGNSAVLPRGVPASVPGIGPANITCFWCFFIDAATTTFTSAFITTQTSWRRIIHYIW